MSSFKEKLSKSVLDARAQNLYELVKTRHELARKLRVAKIELALAMQVDEEEFPAGATESINLDDVKGDITNPLDN